MPTRWIALLLVCVFVGSAAADDATIKRFAARDSLAVDAIPATGEDEADALAGLEWEPRPFDVTAMTAPPDRCDAFVFFPSPKPSGDKVVDRVAMEWYAARDAAGQPKRAPAVLLVHTLHPDMPMERAVARLLAGRGAHVFLVQMPGYGLRVAAEEFGSGVVALERGAQAVADVRRAKDAIRVLPNVADDPVALVGVSLGGFAAATAGALDRAFDPVMLFISGGDGYRVLQEGAVDARYLRDAMAAAGYRGERLRDLLWPSEPLRVAHRLDPDRTWLVLAKHDQVIPAWSSDALAQRIGIRPTLRHHLQWTADHYTFALWLPSVADLIATTIGLPPATP